jgi:hypothetical protein
MTATLEIASRCADSTSKRDAAHNSPLMGEDNVVGLLPLYSSIKSNY